MTRIGVIADNHSQTADGSDVPQAVLDAFAGVDLIVHCGDAGSWGTLDRLATVAPVVAVKGGHHRSSAGDRVQGQKRVVDIGGVRAGGGPRPLSPGARRGAEPPAPPQERL